MRELTVIGPAFHLVGKRGHGPTRNTTETTAAAAREEPSWGKPYKRVGQRRHVSSGHDGCGTALAGSRGSSTTRPPAKRGVPLPSAPTACAHGQQVLEASGAMLLRLLRKQHVRVSAFLVCVSQSVGVGERGDEQVPPPARALPASGDRFVKTRRTRWVPYAPDKSGFWGPQR